ncbi:MAG: AMP-binding protein [Bdellovibrio sp.]|nr:AMP-binding protein [Bdellovibrio sp.]
MLRSPWLNALKETLHLQGSPVFESRNIPDVSEILSAANLWARALARKRLLAAQGFKSGDVLCELSLSQDLLVNLIACNMLDGCFFPLKKSEFEELLTNEASDLPVYLWNNLGLAKAYCNADQAVQIRNAKTDSVLLLKTSGTTGLQKYVGISGDAILHQVKSFISVLDLKPEDGRLIVLPLHHCFGLILDLMLGLFAKQTIFLRSELKFEAAMIFDLLKQHEIRHISLVPRMVELLVIHAEQNPLEAPLLRSLHVHVGGAMIGETLRTKATKLFGGWVEGYGLTECAGGVLLNGKPNNCEVKLKPSFDSNVIHHAELWVKSPAIGKFANQNEFDAEGFFNTGDLARLTSDRGIEVVGRAGQLIKDQRGLWVDLNSLQEKIQQQMKTEPIWIYRHGCEIRVAIIQEDENKSNLITNYLESHFSLKVAILVVEKSLILKIISDSQKKSSQEALAEWVGKVHVSGL